MLQVDRWKRIVIWLFVALGLVFALPNAFYSRVEGHNDAAPAIDAGIASEAQQISYGAWPTWMPSSLVNLGLDLRGGAHLLAEVRVEDVYSARMDALWPELRDALRDARDEVGPIRRTD